MMNTMLIVQTTVPDVASGVKIAKGVVEGRVAACVSMIPGLRSFYWWEGKVQDEEELLLVAKVRDDQLEAYEQMVSELHPYDVPEIVAFPVAAVHEPYLRWVLEEGKMRDPDRSS